jgi:exopolysaccharide biosynthesis protein
MRKLAFLIACVLALGASPAWADPPQVDPAFRVPAGFRVTAERQLGPGLIQATLVRNAPAAVVTLAVRRAGSPDELRVVLSNDAIAGPTPRLERTSSMCARIDCLVAVNGDFFGDATGQPVGAVIADDQLLRSPNPKHHQLSESASGALSAGPMSWRGTLVPSDLQQLSLNGVNVTRNNGNLILYTPAEGATTGTNPFGVELALQVVRPTGPIRLGKTTLVRITELRRAGDTPIPQGGAVLSGHGKGQRALEDLWARVQAGTADPEALLRLDVTPGAVQSIGGSPILVRDGRRWFPEETRDLYSLRAPRTLAGWTADGNLLLATVDGRQAGYSIGMTMDEAADLMIGLGATEAINLDGGGSTAFVVDGAVINRPSDRAVRRDGNTLVVKSPRPSDRVIGNVERPVAVALVLVGPRVAATLGGAPANAGLVVPIGSRGAPPGTGSMIALSGAEGPDASVLAMVLFALGVAVVTARRRRIVVAASPAR